MYHLKPFNDFTNEQILFNPINILQGTKDFIDFFSKDFNPFDSERETGDPSKDTYYRDAANKYKGTGKFPDKYTLHSNLWTQDIGKWFNIPKPPSGGKTVWNNQSKTWVTSLGGSLSMEDIESDIRKYLLPDAYNKWVEESVLGEMLEGIIKFAVAPEYFTCLWTIEGFNRMLPRPGKPWTPLDVLAGACQIFMSNYTFPFFEKWLNSAKQIPKKSLGRVKDFFNWLKSKISKNSEGISALLNDINQKWKDVVSVLWNAFKDKLVWQGFIRDLEQYAKNSKQIQEAVKKFKPRAKVKPKSTVKRKPVPA